MNLSIITGQIQDEYQAACRCADQAIRHAIRIGELLTQSKDHAAYGGWERWIEENFEFSPRMARKYMRLYLHADRVLENGDSNGLTINSALVLISNDRKRNDGSARSAVVIQKEGDFDSKSVRNHGSEVPPQHGDTASTMKTPARPGKPLGDLESSIGDDGETGFHEQHDVVGDPPQGTTQSSLSPACRPRMAGAGMSSHASFVRPDLVGGSFGRVYLEFYQMIGGWRKTNWAGIDRESAVHHLQVLLDLLNLEE